MDFMGPFARSERGNQYIFHVVDYFSRYSWTYPLPTNTKEDTLSALSELFDRFTTPITIYADKGTHFDNHLLKAALRERGMELIFSAPGASHSAGMIERSNQIVQQVFKKTTLLEHATTKPTRPKSQATQARVRR